MADANPTAAEPMKEVRPVRATNHCRHYSYKVGPDQGPRCARNADQSAGVGPCMPEPRGACPQREEYTEDERKAWDIEVRASLERVSNAIGVLPKPIPLRTSGKVTCPNCAAPLHYSRWHRGAAIQCETANCTGPVRFNIAAGADWPS
jgi:hypothetical protein